MSELRQLIREILIEELGQIRGSPVHTPRVTEEQVRIRSDADLAGFVQRLLRAARDGRIRADIEAGRHVFRLADMAGTGRVRAHQPMSPAPQVQPPIRFERGLVSERDVAILPKGTRRIEVGKSVRFTPLAQDELRRHGIKIERAAS